MSKHVSSGDDNAAASQRDAATESLTTRGTADDVENRLPQGAPGGRNGDGTKDAVGAAAKDSVKDSVKDVTKDSAGEPGAKRAQAGDAVGATAQIPADHSDGAAADVSAGKTRAAGAGSSTADTRLAGTWVSPDTQNAATIGVGGPVSDAAKKARAKTRKPWYRRRVVVGAAGVALLAGSFAAGWGTNELLGNDSRDGTAGRAQQDSGNGQGMPGGGPGGPGGQGGPGDQGGAGGQMPGGGPGGQGGPGGHNSQGGPAGGSGGAGRTTPNGDAPGGSGSGEAGQQGGSGSSGVLQQQDSTEGTEG